MSIAFGTQTPAAEQNFIMVYLVGVSNGCGTQKKFPRAYARTFWNPPFQNPTSAPGKGGRSSGRVEKREGGREGGS